MFDSMWSDCEKEVAKCHPCQVFNVGQCGFQPMLTIVVKWPWDHIAMDLIGLLKCSERGFVFILIIIDVLTRFVVLKPLRTKEAKEIETNDKASSGEAHAQLVEKPADA